MGLIDVLIGAGVIGGFFYIIGSKIYDHEKEHLDPMIARIKGWFSKGDDSEESFDPAGDFNIEYRGAYEG